MKLDSRYFSKEAYQALTTLKSQLPSKYHGKASSLVQGLPAYIATWGLHRLSGDMKKFQKRGKSDSPNKEDTGYKGEVYSKFLSNLKSLSGEDFKPNDESTLLNLELSKYTALNRLAMQLAKEWSFWAVAVLGEAQDE